MIISAEWLKTVSRKGLGSGVFAALRASGNSVFDDTRYAGSPILIAGRNFACGSSREHAVWALQDFGVKAVIASSFSDIFAGNAYKNGLLTVVVDEDSIYDLLTKTAGEPIRIDLISQIVTAQTGESFGFEFDSFRKQCLLRGLDEISLTEQDIQKVAQFEMAAKANRPFFDVPFGRVFSSIVGKHGQ